MNEHRQILMALAVGEALLQLFVGGTMGSATAGVLWTGVLANLAFFVAGPLSLFLGAFLLRRAPSAARRSLIVAVATTIGVVTYAVWTLSLSEPGVPAASPLAPDLLLISFALVVVIVATLAIRHNASAPPPASSS